MLSAMRPVQILSAVIAITSASFAAEPKPVPRMQAVPQPRDEVSFQRDGEEIARFHFAKDQHRPFVLQSSGRAGAR